MKRSTFAMRAAFAVTLTGTVSLWGCALIPGLGQGPAANESGPASRNEQLQSIRESIQSLQDTIKEVGSQASKIGSSATQATSAYSGSATTKYRVQGRLQYSNGGTFEWDDATKQLTRIYDTQSDVRLSFGGKDQEERTISADLLRSPDGTTGTLRAIVAAEGWTPQYSYFMAPPPPASSYNSSPYVAPTPPPYEIFFNEIPDFYSLKKVEVSVGLLPQGNQASAYQVTVGADDFQLLSFKLRQRLGNLMPRPSSCYGTYDGQGQSKVICSSPPPAPPVPPFNAPNRVYVRGAVSKLAWDQGFGWKDAGTDALDVTMTGSVTFKTSGAGDQTWHNKLVYHLSPRFEDARIDFTLDNKDKQLRIEASMKPKKMSEYQTGSVLTGDVFSTQNDEKIGTISYDSTKGDLYPTIDYTDGTKQVIKFEGVNIPGFSGFPGLPGPAVAVPTTEPMPMPKATGGPLQGGIGPTPWPTRTPSPNSGSGLVDNNGAG